MTDLAEKYINGAGEILRVIQFHDNPDNPYRYRVWDVDFDPIPGSEVNLTAEGVLKLIPEGFKPVVVP